MALTFDATYYYQQRSDVLDAYLNSDMSLTPYQFALSHYNLHGWREGANPHPVFDTKEYLDANSDVKDAGVNPFDHFNNHGLAEGRAPSSKVPGFNEFDWETYVNANSDLQTAGINTAEAAYNHYINHGYAENRPGSPDSGEVKLEKALADLVAASDAAASALEAAALLHNSNETVPLTGAPLDTFVAGYDADDVAVELAQAQVDVANAESALAIARAATSDAALAQAHATALANVQANAIALGLYNDREAARADLAADVAANGSDLEVLVALRDALLSAIEGGLLTTTALHGGGDTVADLLDDLNAEIASPTAATSAALIDQIAGYDSLSALDDTAAEDIAKVADERDALNDAVTAADVAFNGDPLGGALVTAEGNLETRQNEIDAVADAQAYLAQYQAAADAVESTGAALEAAKEALEDLGYNEPVDLAAGLNTATDGGDILIYEDPATGTLNSTVTGFGADGEDLIFFGDGFTTVNLAAGEKFADGGKGNAGALEIFIQQVGANTVLYVEDDTFDGSVPAALFGGNTITLVGVDASSLVYENGYIRIADAVA